MFHVNDFEKLYAAHNDGFIVVRIAPVGNEEDDVVFDYDEMTDELAMQIALLADVPSVDAAFCIARTFSKTYHSADEMREALAYLEDLGFMVECFNRKDWTEKY